MITLNLNAKLQPKHRFDIEDYLGEYLEENKLGSVDGGGTSMADNGEIESCDIVINCTEETIHKVIEFLKGVPLPRGSKIKFDSEENTTEISIGKLEGLGFYFSNKLEKEVYESNDINDVIEKLDELLYDQSYIFSYCETNEFTAVYYYGVSFVKMAESIVDYVSSHPLCENGEIVELTKREVEKTDNTDKNELYIQIENLYDTESEEDAITLYETADESLKTPDVKSFIAVGYNNNGQYDKAVELLISLENQTSNELKRLYRLAYAYWSLDEKQHCAKTCEKVFELSKISPELDINNYVEDCEMFYNNAIGASSYESNENFKNSSLEMYEEDELEVVESHIEKEFGKFANVYHELISPDIHVDICIINPTEERNYYTLVTMGMGAHKMNVPDDYAHRSRAELCIYLPSNWKMDNNDEKWYWPMRWLKILARLPIEQNTWLGHLHTIPSGETLADNTGLEGFILHTPDTVNESGATCSLPNGEIVNFYAIIPLYEAEMSYKLDHGGEALIDRLDENLENIYLVDIYRASVVDDETAYAGTIDSAHAHMQSIFEKELDLGIFAAYNHIAIYLRWMIENDLMCAEFCENYQEVIDIVDGTQSSDDFDLRVFLHKQFNGRLIIYLFNETGAHFTAEYYGENQYPMDVDKNAVIYFGGKKDEHKDEDYLYVPYDEAYYQSMKKYIDQAYAEYQNKHRKWRS